MPAGTKRQLETAQKPVSTRRRAKKAKLAAATQAQKDGLVSSNKDRRRAAKSSKNIEMSSLNESDEEDEGHDNIQGEEEEEEEEEEESRTEKETLVSKQALRHESEDEDEDQDSDNDDLNKGDEVIGKGKKGYRKKVKKPSGKKGKVFANTGKIRTKLSEKEQKQAAKDKAKKALIEKKIEEIKRKKAEKRKVAKQRAGTEQKGNVPSGKKSVSFRV
ncbi:hypothetical protein BGX34_009230 [Mortierella sp. NVP85]|nr:hypothetical protein BGX34_009230 [Mortierella sp. NVP85]